MICNNALNSRKKPAVSLMSGSPTFDIDKRKKKQKRGEFTTPPRPTGRRSNKNSIITHMYCIITPTYHHYITPIDPSKVGDAILQGVQNCWGERAVSHFRHIILY